MGWIIQNQNDGPIILADINMTFSARQIRDIDIIGRENADKSNDLQLMIQKGFLKEVRKDKHIHAADPTLQKLTEEIKEHREQTSDRMAVVEKQNDELKRQNDELKQQNLELHSKVDTVLSEVRDFVAKFPLQAKTIAEAMRSIQTERQGIAMQKDALPDSNLSEDEIKAQERILSLKDKKLEKNGEMLGKTVSKSANDIKESLAAMDELGIDL